MGTAVGQLAIEIVSIPTRSVKKRMGLFLKEFWRLIADDGVRGARAIASTKGPSPFWEGL
jgi:hypothetical protein